MADTINERGLPGGPQAARAAVKWAQAHVDNDWNEWNGDGSSWQMTSSRFTVHNLSSPVCPKRTYSKSLDWKLKMYVIDIY